MQIHEIKNEGLELHFKVQVPSETFANNVSTKLQKIAPTLNLPGFRPGKVPLKILEQRYRPTIAQEELQDVIRSNIENIVKQNNVKLASEVRVEDVKLEDGSDVEFTVILERMPEIEDIDLSSIEIERPIVKISQELVDEKMQALLDSRRTYTKADKSHKARKGDRVLIDFEGFLDNVPFEGGKGTNHNLVLGSGSFVPGFEEKLEGVQEGDNLSITVTFPDNYTKKLASQTTEFRIFVHEVQTPNEVEFTEEMAKHFNAANKEEVEQRIKAVLSHGYESTSMAQAKLHLFDKLESILNFEVPKTLLETEKEYLLREASLALEDKDFQSNDLKNQDDYCSKLALRRVRIGLMLASYAEKNDIKVSTEEQYQEIQKQIMQSPELEARIINYYKTNPKALKVLIGSIVEDKAVTHIIENKIKVRDVEYSVEDYQKILDGDE